jgi:hypothetical protein
MEVSGQLHAQAALLLWKEAPVPTNITGCLSPTASLFWERKQNLPPLLEIEPHFLGCPFPSLVTSNYTILVHLWHVFIQIMGIVLVVKTFLQLKQVMILGNKQPNSMVR